MSKVNNTPQPKMEVATKSKKAKTTTSTRTRLKPASKNKTPAKPKGKPGRPKVSKNKPKAVVAPEVSAAPVETVAQPETNDRLIPHFDHNGVPEPKSVPRPAPTKAVVMGDSVVMDGLAPEPMQPIEKMSLPKPTPSFDGMSVVMETKPDAIEAYAKIEKASVKNEDGVLIVQEPFRTVLN
jgi:hypothetical protein